MAQTGYTPISFYYSSTSSNIPSAGNLVNGEIAINTADGVIYYKNSGGSVVPLAFGSTGLTWQSVQTADFTAVAGEGYPVNTTSGQITVTLPATPAAGDLVTLTDYTGTFATNNLIIDPNGNNLLGSADSVKMETNNESLSFVYIDATQGWLPYDGFNSSIPQVALYLLQNSLRFRASNSAYLSRTPGSNPTSNQKLTFSTWVKVGAIAAQNTLLGNANNTAGEVLDFFGSKLRWSSYNIGSLTTNQIFVDPAAWYHIVISIDTTQATASNRVLMYVNGVQVTSFASATYPTQNNTFQITNINGGLNYIGSNVQSSGPYPFDGYLSEVNMIDGQQLTASSFGATDSTTGSWIPIQYTGTYGTNGFYLPFTSNRNSSYAGSFNGSSQYLQVPTVSAALQFGTADYTVETWMYQTNQTASQVIYDGRSTTGGSGNAIQVFTDTSGSLFVYGGVNVATLLITSSAPLRTNRWNHIAVVRSSGTTTLYVNGVQSGSSVSDTTNYNATTSGAMIGALFNQAANFFAGYMSNFRIVNGTAVYTANFTPSTTPLTAITNTSLLTLQNSTFVDNSTNAFSITNGGGATTSVQYPFNVLTYNDQSGNSNNWTANNFSQLNGSTYDSMTDVPTLTSATTANYCTLNPLDGNAVLSNGNLTITGANQYANATIAPTSGKFYWETTLQSVYASIYWASGGLIPVNTPAGSSIAYGYVGYYATNDGSAGGLYQNGTRVFTYTSWATNDVIGLAYDVDNLTLTVYRNNTQIGSPLTVNPAYVIINQFQNGTGGSPTTSSFNFGQQPFTYTPPTGYVALNTFNL